eukprot:RCo012862
MQRPPGFSEKRLRREWNELVGMGRFHEVPWCLSLTQPDNDLWAWQALLAKYSSRGKASLVGGQACVEYASAFSTSSGGSGFSPSPSPPGLGGPAPLPGIPPPLLGSFRSRLGGGPGGSVSFTFLCLDYLDRKSAG